MQTTMSMSQLLLMVACIITVTSLVAARLKDSCIERDEDKSIPLNYKTCHRYEKLNETIWPRIEDLPKSTKCQPGYYAQCLPCPLGYYKKKQKNKPCDLCGSGSGTPAEGAEWCTKLCKAGTHLQDDGKGKTRNCTSCEIGFYQPYPNLDYICVPCPNNMTTKKKGRTSINSCFSKDLTNAEDIHPATTTTSTDQACPEQPTCSNCEQCPECPEQSQCPITCPTNCPCPECPTLTEPPPCPTPKEQQPCPACPTCPTTTEPPPCPTCPAPTEPPQCPTCPTTPEPQPCPTCPTCPTTTEPAPCPTPTEPLPCPTCPTTTEPPPCPTWPTPTEPTPCPTCANPTEPPPCPTTTEPLSCPTCPTGCEHSGTKYHNGDEFTPDGGCTSCVCQNNAVTCTGNKVCDRIRTASQSSNHTSHIRPASLAIDGDPSTIAHTASVPVVSNPWWKLEYECVQTFYAVVVTNRNDCCFEQLGNLVITIDDQVCGRIGTAPGSGVRHLVECEEPLTGKTLKIHKEKRELINLAEVKPLIAKPSGC